MTFSVCYATQAMAKDRLERDADPDLCDAGANCEDHKLSAVQMKLFLFDRMYPLSTGWLIIDPRNDQLPVGLIAQLVEHCAAYIAEVSVQEPFTTEFFKAFHSLLLK